MQPERIQRLARDERLARHAGFWWGLAEGLFFFIVPDVYISFATLFALRAGALAWLFSIPGSMIAVTIIYVLMAVLGLDYLAFVDTIPAISHSMIVQVGRSLAAEGLPYTPFLASGGVPLKLYAASAFSLGLSLGSVLVWTVFARIVRIAPTFAAAAAMRVLFGRQIDARPRVWFAGFSLFWLVFYVFYFIRMG
ncbi:MAG TPA: hypothetical protein VFS51_07325 [Gemmatimonadales bacterium]|nr:hypothetical protein [Gemmatimonadales bacterium]